MTAAIDLKKRVRELPKKQRAQRVTRLLDSLPAVLIDQDAGVAEALKRNAEWDAQSQQALSLEDLDAAIHSRRR